MGTSRRERSDRTPRGAEGQGGNRAGGGSWVLRPCLQVTVTVTVSRVPTLSVTVMVSVPGAVPALY